MPLNDEQKKAVDAYIAQRPGDQVIREVLNSAAGNNNLDILVYILDKFNRSTSLREALEYLSIGWVLETAAKNGHFEIVQYLLRRYEKNTDLDQIDFLQINGALAKAAENGHFEIVKYILECYNKNQADEVMERLTIGRAFMSAAGNNHFEIVAYILNYYDYCINDAERAWALYNAAANDHLDIIKCIILDYHDRNPAANLIQTLRIFNVLESAAVRNHLEIVEYIFKKYGQDQNADAARALEVAYALGNAAENGYLRIVACIFEHYGQVADVMQVLKIDQVLNSAARNKKIEVMTYILKTCGKEIDYTASIIADIRAAIANAFLLPAQEANLTDLIDACAATEDQILLRGIVGYPLAEAPEYLPKHQKIILLKQLIAKFPEDLPAHKKALIECVELLNKQMIQRAIDQERVREEEHARDTVLDDHDCHTELQRVCNSMKIPCDDVISQGIIKNVVKVTSSRYTEAYRAQFKLPQDYAEYIQYYDLDSIRPLKIDPITNRIIISIKTEPKLTKKLNQIIKKLAEDKDYFKNIQEAPEPYEEEEEGEVSQMTQ
jgi:hypothetical protein